MAVMSFLTGLSSEFDIAKSHILFSSKISFLHDTFTRLFRTDNTYSQLALPFSGTLVSRNEHVRQSSKGGQRG